LEGYRSGELIVNQNISQNFGQQRPIELGAAIDFLLSQNNLLPIEIKVGGYRKNFDYHFTSQETHPYLRSFSINGTIAVAMGWPSKNGQYTSDIDQLRRAFNKFNIIHKYHHVANAYDNDFFFVIGKVNNKLEKNVTTTCETLIRDLLSKTDIPAITIDKDQLKIIPYMEGDISFQKAKSLTLEQAKERIVELKNFYPRKFVIQDD
jgi:hypothetical protein